MRDEMERRSSLNNGNSGSHAALVVSTFNTGTEPITCHAWNGDTSQLAISRNSNEVQIFETSGGGNAANSSSRSTWSDIGCLTAHDLRVTGIDWAPRSNRIVTCSADRNAYVWERIDGEWKKTLVLLRTNRAATSVKWSPDESKFAVGCGAKLVAICYFDEENDWWLSKHMKKPLKSTVTSVDWHPNSLLLAVGATDFRCRVYSAFVKEIDKKQSAGGAAPTSWTSAAAAAAAKGAGPIKLNFGALLAEFPSSGWIHEISFSRPSGDRLLWVSHDSSISVVDASKDIHRVVTRRTDYLPFYSAIWLNERQIVGVGHSCSPVLFLYDAASSALHALGALDQTAQDRVEQSFSARQKFRDLDEKATLESKTTLDTLHQNAITQVLPLQTSGVTSRANTPSMFSTVGQDGLLVVWKYNPIESKMNNMRIS